MESRGARSGGGVGSGAVPAGSRVGAGSGRFKFRGQFFASVPDNAFFSNTLFSASS